MPLEIIILAAGQGTRMNSALPKVMHPVAGRPLLQHVLDAAWQLQPSAVHVVVGHGADQVRRSVTGTVTWVEQAEQLGTGHAVMQALPEVSEESTVLVLYGDVPLIEPSTLKTLISLAASSPSLLTANVEDAAGYGRVLRGANDAVIGVVEDKDATPQELEIREINTGVLAAPARDFLRYLPAVGNDNKQGEYYLPDILGLAVAAGQKVSACQAASEFEILGVNDRLQLNQVEREYQRRQARALLAKGVSVADPGRLDIRGRLATGSDVSIDVNVVFEGEVSLGDGVRIGPNCLLKNVVVESGATIHAMSHLEDVKVGSGCNVGPFARLRPGTVLADGARIGNFVEIKNTHVGAGSKVNHLSYVGDCAMGTGVNIGAGTITCNYDGANKHRTEIGDAVFVGSNSTLVAPLMIEEGGFIGAGSTVTRTVEKGELAVGRTRQRNLRGWQRPTREEG